MTLSCGSLARLFALILFASTASVTPLSGQPAAFDPARKPPKTAEEIVLLLGEYADGNDTLLVYERDGELRVRDKDASEVRLVRKGEKEFTAESAHREKGLSVAFEGSHARPEALTFGDRRYARMVFDGEDGKTFTIAPRYSEEELIRRAKAARPPREKGLFRKSELVEIRSLDSSIRYDIRYASNNNFMRQRFYSRAEAYLQRPAAEAFARAHAWLGRFGYGLLVHDAYRPWRVTKMFWDATPNSMKSFVANPADGSRHNRGCAVDVTLFDRTTGMPVSMVSGYDEFSRRAYPHYEGGTSLQRWHRRLLRTALEREGFAVYAFEWWHFDFKDWRKYRIGVKDFEELSR